MNARIVPLILLLVTGVLLNVSFPVVHAAESESHFIVEGDVVADVDEATATLIKIRNRIPALNIISSPAATKKLGGSYSVNLFFPNGFVPKPGSYSIDFSYRSDPTTLGGSFLSSGKLFSHDTSGSAEFTEFGDRVSVRFEFQVASESAGNEGRKVVTVRGQAVCEMADIF